MESKQSLLALRQAKPVALRLAALQLPTLRMAQSSTTGTAKSSVRLKKAASL
jgi:hypothetical protein